MTNRMRSIAACAVVMVALSACEAVNDSSNGASSPNGATSPDSSGPTPATPEAVQAQVPDDTLTSEISNAAVSVVLGAGVAKAATNQTTLIPPLSVDSIPALPSPACISVANTSTGIDIDIVETLNCPAVTGAISISGTEGVSLSLVTQFDHTLPNDASSSSAATTEVTENLRTGVLTASHIFDHKFAGPEIQFEAQGTGSLVLTPEGPDAGTAVVQGQGTFLKVGGLPESYNVTSSGVTFEACGINGGTLEIVTTTRQCSITYTACGTQNVACQAIAP